MNSNWNNHTLGAQAFCLGGGACVPVTMAMRSVDIRMDFIDHDPGGS